MKKNVGTGLVMAGAITFAGAFAAGHPQPVRAQTSSAFCAYGTTEVCATQTEEKCLTWGYLTAPNGMSVPTCVLWGTKQTHWYWSTSGSGGGKPAGTKPPLEEIE